MKFPMETKIVRLIGSESDDNCIFAAERRYIIPEYQREYSWAEKQIKEFIESIKRAASGNDVFMGTVQFTREENNEYHIIDGQQRMTTFCLLFYNQKNR